MPPHTHTHTHTRTTQTIITIINKHCLRNSLTPQRRYIFRQWQASSDWSELRDVVLVRFLFWLLRSHDEYIDPNVWWVALFAFYCAFVFVVRPLLPSQPAMSEHKWKEKWIEWVFWPRREVHICHFGRRYTLRTRILCRWDTVLLYWCLGWTWIRTHARRNQDQITNLCRKYGYFTAGLYGSQPRIVQ